MSRSLSRWKAVLLGLVVLTGLGLTVFGLFLVGARGWFGRNALGVRTGFAEIRGVEVGTRVRIQGIDSGEVTAISPPDEPGGPVVLHLRIDERFRHLVYSTSVVQIVSEGMIGGKVVEVRPPTRRTGDRTLAPEGAMLESMPSAELTDVLAQVSETLGGAAKGGGTIGKLLNDPEAYNELVKLLRGGSDTLAKGQATMESIQRDADALKKVPILGGYIEDPVGLLVRKDSERNRRVFSETELFGEPERAVLTRSGEAALDELGPWLRGLNQNKSDVVVVAYADTAKGRESAVAKATSQQQADAVLGRLKSKFGVHQNALRLPTRKARALGMGNSPPPVKEASPQPPARVEVIVFVPQK